MKKMLALTAAVISLSAITAFGKNEVLLEWKLEKGERLELVRTAGVRTYVNRKITRSYHERNIIDLSCYNSESSAFSVQGDFSVYAKENGDSVFRLERKEYSDFLISRNGEYSIPEQYIMPNLRNIPVFKEGSVSEGDEWEAPASLVFDNFSPPVVMKFPVHYRLVRVEEKNGKKTAFIKYEYEFERKLPERGGDSPGSFGGKNSGELLWDLDGKKPLDGSDFYRVGFLYPDGTFMEMQMNFESDYKIYPMIDRQEKERRKNELQNDLKDNKGISVDSDDRGLVLRMGEILFDFDSSELKPDTKKTLDDIRSIIKKKYPDSEIIVEGHSDNIGKQDYNKSLSEKRASSVADFLKKGLGHDKLSYRGYGAERPIGDNSTKDGQAKNRRVEIIIKAK